MDSIIGYEPKVVAAGVSYSAVGVIAGIGGAPRSELHVQGFRHWTAKLKHITGRSPLF